MDRLATEIYEDYIEIFEDVYQKSENFREYIDNGGTTDIYDMEYLFRSFGHEVRYYYGSFKRVFWDVNSDYVVKFDINWDESDFYSSCADEERIYERAVENGVEDFFNPIIKLGEYRGIQLWAAPVVNIDDDSNYFYISEKMCEYGGIDYRNELEREEYIEEISSGNNISGDIGLTNAYIEAFHPSLYKFLLDNQIEDLHCQNYTIEDGCFLLTDYSC